MTNPYARPDQPDPQQPWTAPQDETIPLVPESGYTSRPSPWSEGYEHTAVDPFAAAPPGYTNPSFDAPAGPQPQRQPQPGYSLPPTAPTYEQPPMAAGYRPYEPLRDPAPAPMVPAYPQHYPMAASLPDHPNAVPTLVLAILGFIVGLTFPIAWYLGAKGTSDIKRQPGRWRPSPMMTVGMVIGIIGTVLMVLGFGLIALGLVAFMVAA